MRRLLAFCLLVVGACVPAAVALPVPDTLGGRWTAAAVRAELVHGALEPSPEAAQERRRSVPVALGLSAAVPGLGQAYNRQWIKAGVALALEAALWTGYVVWNAEGAEGRDAYQAYAHAYWDPTRYGTWLNDYKAYLNLTRGAGLTAPDAPLPSGIDFTNPGLWSEVDRARVQAFFDALRAIEAQAFHLETGAAFSHRIPYFGEQQYYELIGKYYQFAPGWRDYPAWCTTTPGACTEGGFTNAIDPNQSGAGGSKPNVSPRFFAYAADHAEANDLLRQAQRMTAFVLLNHFLAAFDAALTAKLHNHRVQTRVALMREASGDVVPRAQLSVRF